MRRALLALAGVVVVAGFVFLVMPPYRGGADAGPGARVPEPVRASGLPVVLVPGWFDTGRNLATLRIRFLGAGWAPDQVVALTFRDPTGDNDTHAQELAQAVDSLLLRTSAAKVDIVAHSMGGLATRRYLELRGPAAPVRRVVLLATPNQGTWSAYLAFGDGRDDMVPGSPFLASLNAAPPLPAGVEGLTVRTPLDVHVLPGESGLLPGVPDLEVCCPTHEGLLRDPEVFQVVRRFLADGVVPAGATR